MKFQFDIRMILDDAGLKSVPDLMFQLLEAVRGSGSVSAAAKQANVSYRKAWNLLNQGATIFGAELVHKHRGQGTKLSALGDALLIALDEVRVKTAADRSKASQQFSHRLAISVAANHASILNVRASHCLSHEILRQLFKVQYGCELSIGYSGSGRSLSHLGTRQCNVAGFHLASGDLGQWFRDQYHGLINPKEIELIEALKREQGLIVKKGNPKSIFKISDLIRSDVCMINRQPHSGTRLLLDGLLRKTNVDSSAIRGYDNEEFTHSAVCALVAGASADVAIGTHASAQRFDLDFLPLISETYYFALYADYSRTPNAKALKCILSGKDWKAGVGAMVGYDTKNAGTVCRGQEVLGR